MREHRILPGYRLTLGITVGYLSLMVILPIIALVAQSTHIGFADYFHQISSKRFLTSIRLSVLTALAASVANGFIGFIIAWSLVRYSFPGKKIIDSMIDIPFALPTAVAGIALTTLYAQNGWVGSLLAHIGIKAAYTPLGIIIALSFVGIPFVIRSVQPVLIDFQKEIEDAASCLGASKGIIFRKILWPQIMPALISGVSLSFARGLGEYGSIVFISGNMPFKTEIVPLLIMTKLEQFNYAAASAIAMTFLTISFGIMLLINVFQAINRQKYVTK
ncbi:MAG: sulfate ABC transporter permease subunit CysT [Fibrobacter sp.]|nr:sulfate ABC transporter permease subunit CysT [Fibrobacter sp.]